MPLLIIEPFQQCLSKRRPKVQHFLLCLASLLSCPLPDPPQLDVNLKNLLSNLSNLPLKFNESAPKFNKPLKGIALSECLQVLAKCLLACRNSFKAILIKILTICSYCQGTAGCPSHTGHRKMLIKSLLFIFQTQQSYLCIHKARH